MTADDELTPEARAHLVATLHAAAELFAAGDDTDAIARLDALTAWTVAGRPMPPLPTPPTPAPVIAEPAEPRGLAAVLPFPTANPRKPE